MIRKILTYPNSVLQSVAKPIDEVDGEAREMLRDLAETMYEMKGIGLAAPQIGMSVRAIVLDPYSSTKDQGKGLLKMVNPVIVSREGEIEFEEACLSVPYFYIRMKRSQRVTVEYLDEAGQAKKLDADGLAAVVIQHEIDHIDGKTIVDYASRLKRDMYVRRRKKLEREGHAPRAL